MSRPSCSSTLQIRENELYGVSRPFHVTLKCIRGAGHDSGRGDFNSPADIHEGYVALSDTRILRIWWEEQRNDPHVSENG